MGDMVPISPGSPLEPRNKISVRVPPWVVKASVSLFGCGLFAWAFDNFIQVRDVKSLLFSRLMLGLMWLSATVLVGCFVWNWTQRKIWVFFAAVVLAIAGIVIDHVVPPPDSNRTRNEPKPAPGPPPKHEPQPAPITIPAPKKFLPPVDLSILAFDSLGTITVGNPNANDAYVVDLVSKYGSQASTSFRLDFLVSAYSTQSHKFADNQINWHLLDFAGNTYAEQLGVAANTYGRN
jgi:hypothetical protein